MACPRKRLLPQTPSKELQKPSSAFTEIRRCARPSSETRTLTCGPIMKMGRPARSITWPTPSAAKSQQEAAKRGPEVLERVSRDCRGRPLLSSTCEGKGSLVCAVSLEPICPMGLSKPWPAPHAPFGGLRVLVISRLNTFGRSPPRTAFLLLASCQSGPRAHHPLTDLTAGHWVRGSFGWRVMVQLQHERAQSL